MKASRFGFFAMMSWNCCTDTREVVVGVERAALDLGPAVLAGQAVARATRADALPASVSRMPCMRSLWLAAAAPPDWMQIVPPFGLIFMHELGEVDADLVVVRADIGDAQILVLGQQVGVPGEHRNAGVLGRLRATAIAAALAGETAMPSTFLATRSCTICTCSSPPPCSPGPMYMHSNAPLRLGFGLLAAVAGLIEERVVHVLRHQREDVLRLGARSQSSAWRRADRHGRSQ